MSDTSPPPSPLAGDEERREPGGAPGRKRAPPDASTEELFRDFEHFYLRRDYSQLGIRPRLKLPEACNIIPKANVALGALLSSSDSSSIYLAAVRPNGSAGREGTTSPSAGSSAGPFPAAGAQANDKAVVVRCVARVLTAGPTRQFWHEVSTWSTLRHENIVRFIGVSLVSEVPVSLCEYYPEGSLYAANMELMTRAKQADPKATPSEWGLRSGWTLRHWVIQLTRAMRYLHSQAIIFRNLKSTNVMLANEGQRIALTDFAIARPVAPELTPGQGSDRWLAPEVTLGSNKYDLRSDVFSFALTCWEMVGCEVPFAQVSPSAASFHIAQGARPALPRKCPQWLGKLMIMCNAQQPEARPTFEQIDSAMHAMGVTDELSLSTSLDNLLKKAIECEEERQRKETHMQRLMEQAAATACAEANAAAAAGPVGSPLAHKSFVGGASSRDLDDDEGEEADDADEAEPEYPMPASSLILAAAMTEDSSPLAPAAGAPLPAAMPPAAAMPEPMRVPAPAAARQQPILPSSTAPCQSGVPHSAGMLHAGLQQPPGMQQQPPGMQQQPPGMQQQPPGMQQQPPGMQQQPPGMQQQPPGMQQQPPGMQQQPPGMQQPPSLQHPHPGMQTHPGMHPPHQPHPQHPGLQPGVMPGGMHPGLPHGLAYGHHPAMSQTMPQTMPHGLLPTGVHPAMAAHALHPANGHALAIPGAMAHGGGVLAPNTIIAAMAPGAMKPLQPMPPMQAMQPGMQQQHAMQQHAMAAAMAASMAMPFNPSRP